MVDIIPLFLIALFFGLTLFNNRKETRGNIYMIVILAIFAIFFVIYGILNKVYLYQSLLFAVIALGLLIRQIRYKVKTNKSIV